MKKYLSVIILCLVYLLASTGEVKAAYEAGKVLAVRKKVYLIRNEARTNAEPQMQLFLKDAIETDKKSRAKLFFSDDSILNLGELSRVSVEEYIYSPDRERSKSVYRLVNGYLKVVVGRSDLEIHTKTALTAARGTEFIVWIEGRGSSRRTCAFVSGGSITMRNVNEEISGELLVEQGKVSCVPINKPPEFSTLMLPKKVKKLKKKTAVMGIVTKKRKLQHTLPLIKQKLRLVKKKRFRRPPFKHQPREALKILHDWREKIKNN